MKKRHWILLFFSSVPLFGLAWCSAPSWQLEAICKKKAGITVIDPVSWAAFMSKVRDRDLADQRARILALQTGAVVAPPDTSQFIRPFPYIEGYEDVPDAGHGHFSGEPQPGRKSQLHNLNIMENGKKIGILHDFEVTVEGIDYNAILKCSIDFPEVFDITRAYVLK